MSGILCPHMIFGRHSPRRDSPNRRLGFFDQISRELVLTRAQRRAGKIRLHTENGLDYPVPLKWFNDRVRGKLTGIAGACFE